MLTWSLWKIPKADRSTFKELYDAREYFVLMRKCNDYEVTNEPLCTTCFDNIAVLKENLPRLWNKSEKDQALQD